MTDPRIEEYIWDRTKPEQKKVITARNPYRIYGFTIWELDNGKFEVCDGAAKGVYETAQQAEDAVEFAWDRAYDRCH